MVSLGCLCDDDDVQCSTSRFVVAFALVDAQRLMGVCVSQGKTRLAKWYVPYEDEERKKLILELYRLVNSRDQKFTNFVEVRARACARFWRAFL